MTVLTANELISVEIAKAHDGGEIRYDGICYDYRDAKAQKGIKLWLPPIDEPIRAILFFGNPGSGGDTRDKALNRTWQDWAAQRQLGIAGVTWFRGGEIYHKTGKNILAVFNSWAELGHHPELADIPFIPRGSSNAGMTAYGLSCYVPERIVCFTSNVGARYNPFMPSEKALQIPALQHIGPVDRFMPLGLKDTAELYQRIRPFNSLWAWDAEEGKGHQDFSQLHIDLAFYSEILDRRLPQAGADIQTVQYDEAWLADTSTWANRWPPRPCHIASFKDYKGNKDTAVWLAGEATAKAYQAAASYHKRIQLTIDDLVTVGPADGQWNINDADLPTVNPDEEIVLRIKPLQKNRMINWSKIEFFNGSQLIGTVTQGNEPVLKTKALPGKIEQVFTVIAYDDESGAEYVANPFGVVVRNKSMSDRIGEQMQTYHQAIAAPSVPHGTALDKLASIETGNDKLIAHALNEQQSAELIQSDSLPGFWQDVPVTSLAQITRHDHSVGRDKAKKPQDIGVEMRAVYCRAGLGLLCLVTDDDLNVKDGFDWHCSWQDPREFSKKSVLENYITGERDLLLEAVQYHASFEQAGGTLIRNIPRGGLLHLGDRKQTLQEAFEQEGIKITFQNWSDGRQAVQWFLPWSAVGIPAQREQPVAGTHLALVLGVNDHDEQDDNSSLRWPHARDPWHNHDFDHPHPQVWGSLVLGSALPRK